jgi:tRNA1Val (adenine37-N6)-methyltransferase
MGNSWFQFQQFRIHQDRCAMKISTDAILLGSMAAAYQPKKILDIGTGTGVIALMIAQRFPQANVSAVELDSDAAKQASENFLESRFSARLTLIHQRIQVFSEAEKFDLIVSNPPFFPDHLKSQDPKRSQALHTDQLSFAELIDKTFRILSDQGKFWVILPPRQMQDFESLAIKSGLFPFQKVKVKDSLIKAHHREVVGFSFLNQELKLSELILKDETGNYTPAYTNLLSGFLLGHGENPV